MNRLLLPLILSISLLFPQEALAADDQWKFVREVTITSSNEYTEVFLDDDFYINAQPDLSDVSVADESGDLVPFYLAGAQDSEIDTNQFTRSTDLKFSVDSENDVPVVTINNPGHLKIKKLHFDITGECDISYDLSGIDGSTTYGLKSGQLYKSNNEDETDSQTYIDLEPEKEGRNLVFKLTLNTPDGTPIELNQVTAFYNVDKVVFAQEPGKTYQIFYGGTSVSKPVNEIVNYRTTIEKGVLNEGILGKKLPYDQANKSSMLTYLLIIGVIVILPIGFIAARKLVKSKAE